VIKEIYTMSFHISLSDKPNCVQFLVKVIKTDQCRLSLQKYKYYLDSTTSS